MSGIDSYQRPNKKRLSRFSIICALLAFGATLLMLNGKYSHHALIPGPISPQHSSFSADCLKCHQNDINHLQFRFSEENSTKCINCHQMGNSPNSPHGVANFPITDIKTNKNDLKVLLAGNLNKIIKTNDALKCSECHSEHKGDKAINFDNNKCQICHQQKFTSFETSHPSFTNYPYRRRTRIIFDHDKHIKNYFKSKDINCSSCHQADKNGTVILVQDFKKSCSSCHLKEINGEGQAQTGLAFIGMPKLDLVSLNLSSTAWPQAADGELTPFLKIMLSNNPTLIAALKLLENTDLSKLDQASEAEKSAVGQILIELKSFYIELYSQGHSAIRKRLEHINNIEIDNLISGFPLSLFRKSLKDWLPGVLKPKLLNKDIDEEELSSEELMQSGGWYREGFSIYYRPKGHADPFIRSWMELSRLVESNQTFGLKEKLFNPATPGRCAYCHSLDKETGVNWLSFKGTEEKSLNRFKHASHFLVMKNQGCTTCHALDPLAKPLSTYEQGDVSKFQSSFIPIDKGLCSDCHAKGKASNNCLECHNYHYK